MDSPQELRAMIARVVVENVRRLDGETGKPRDLWAAAYISADRIIPLIQSARPSTGMMEALEKANALLFELYSLTAMLPYEPDEGQPHPLKDGTYDQIMLRVNAYLQDYDPGQASGGECSAVFEAASDLVALWTNPTIRELPRAERNAAIAGARERLIDAVGTEEPIATSGYAQELPDEQGGER